MKIKRRVPDATVAFLLCLTILSGTNASLALGAETNTGTVTFATEQQTSDKTQTGSGEYLHEEQFSADHSLSGINAQCVEYFEAGDWNIGAASITLRHSAAKSADSITISLNGQAFYSQQVVSSGDGKMQEVTADLPIDAIKSGQNSVTVNVYIKGGTDTDENSKAESVLISKESSIALKYSPKATVGTIADFCSQFVSIDALENKQSAVTARSEASDTALTAAALVLSEVSGRASMYYSNIDLNTADDESALYSGKYRIYICEYSSLMAGVLNALTDEEKQAAQNGALLALLKSQNGSNVLLLTGSQDDAIINAAKLIGNSEYLSQLQTPWKGVTASENVLMQKTQVDRYRLFTDSGTYLTGQNKQSVSYYIKFPNNRLLSYSSQVSLAMRYSADLDFDVSMVTVYINDEPIGSKKLEEDRAHNDSAVFDIPSDMKVSGNFTVKVTFDLEVNNKVGTSTESVTPWAWISNDSMLSVCSTNVDTLLFENYPGPFVKDGSFNNVVAVLPDLPGSADLETLRLILLTMGRFVEDNTGSLRIAHASFAGNLGSSNVISIGSYSRNLIVKENNDKLFFKFSTDGKTLASNEKMLIDSNYGKTLGTVQMLVSPFSGGSNYALLAVSGADDEAMLCGVKYIGSTDNIWKIYGDGYVADKTQVFPFRFKADNAKTQSLVSQVLTRADIRGVALTAGIIITLVLIALIFMFLKYKKERREDEK